MSSNVRNSNIELLRIVAMSMIIILHFLGHVMDETFMPPILYDMFKSYVICGVNLFFMISGFFLIRLSFKGLYKVLILMAVYQFVNWGLLYIMGTQLSAREIISELLFPISHSPYWFMKVYLMMMVCAPLINLGLEAMDTRKLRRFIIIFSIFTIYSCSLGHNLSNPSGYSFLQGIYMYCIAYYIRRDFRVLSQISSRIYIIIAFATLTASGLGIYLFDTQWFNDYNSIGVLIASFCIFIAFAKLDFKNKAINIVASCALGCYLLQDGLFGIKFLYGHLHQLLLSNPPLQSFFIMIGVFIGLWIVAFVVNAVQNGISSRLYGTFVAPVEQRLSSLLKQLTDV